MKYKIGINDLQIATIMQSAEREIPKIQAVRKLASDLVEIEVKSLTGENEIYDFLSLPEYPKATRQTSANLLGKSKEYLAFTEALSRLKSLKRFDINASNEVIISPDYRALITEEQTTYLADEYVPIWKQLEKASKELQKVNSLMNNSLASRMIWSHQDGRCGADFQQFQRLVIHKGRY
jgi:hypothetical protein